MNIIQKTCFAVAGVLFMVAVFLMYQYVNEPEPSADLVVTEFYIDNSPQAGINAEKPQIPTVTEKTEPESYTVQATPRQETTDTAKNLVDETSTKLKETVDEQIEKNPIKPDQIPIKIIPETPKEIQESNPVNPKPIIDTYELEKQIHQLTNQYRNQYGLSTLLWDDRLSHVARIHSKDMASRGYFSHNTPEGLDPTDRGELYGYKCEKRVGNLIYYGIAENIFQNNLYDTVWYSGSVPVSYDWNTQVEIAQSTVDGWMSSPGHRENILTKTYDREGIGIAISSDDKVYITQNFC